MKDSDSKVNHHVSTRDSEIRMSIDADDERQSFLMSGKFCKCGIKCEQYSEKI